VEKEEEEEEKKKKKKKKKKKHLLQGWYLRFPSITRSSFCYKYPVDKIEYWEVKFDCQWTVPSWTLWWLASDWPAVTAVGSVATGYRPGSS